MASVLIPIGSNTLQESALSTKNSSREDATLEESIPQTEHKSDESQRQRGELSKFIRQQAQSTTPSQPISPTGSVVQIFETFCEQ